MTAGLEHPWPGRQPVHLPHLEQLGSALCAGVSGTPALAAAAMLHCLVACEASIALLPLTRSEHLHRLVEEARRCAAAGLRPVLHCRSEATPVEFAARLAGLRGSGAVVLVTARAGDLSWYAGLEGWWLAEPADAPALAAQLATAVLDEHDWLLRLPEAFVADLPDLESGSIWEPGAGRRCAGSEEARQLLLAPAAQLAAALALQAGLGSDWAVLHLSSLLPWPWQAWCGESQVLLADPAQQAGLAACRRRAARSSPLICCPPDAQPDQLQALVARPEAAV